MSVSMPSWAMREVLAMFGGKLSMREAIARIVGMVAAGELPELVEACKKTIAREREEKAAARARQANPEAMTRSRA